jgi:hypothetical protein
LLGAVAGFGSPGRPVRQRPSVGGVSMVVHKPGSYEERECSRCFEGLVYDGQLGAWVGCDVCSGTGRAIAFVYPKTRRLRGCASCGGRFSGRDLVSIIEEHMMFFEGDELCRSCAVRHCVA